MNTQITEKLYTIKDTENKKTFKVLAFTSAEAILKVKLGAWYTRKLVVARVQ